MPLNTIPTQHSLTQLASIIRKDPASWEHWTARRISFEKTKKDNSGFPFKKEIKELMKILPVNKNSVPYFCENAEITILTEGVNANELDILTREIRAFLCTHNYLLKGQKFFNLQKDWVHFVNTCEEGEARAAIRGIDMSLESKETLIEHEIRELFELHSIVNKRKNLRIKPTVLLVEDEPIARKLVSKLLNDEVDLIMATNLHEGLMHYAMHAPDLVLLDINLEYENDGKIFLQTVRHYDDSSKIIMFSSASHIENRIDTIENGANGFLSKPFHKDQLMHYVEQVI